MGLGFEEGNVKSWDTSKSKVMKMMKKKNSEKEDLDAEATVEETGCWPRFRFIGSCISSRSKVDTSVSGTSTNYDSKSAYDTGKDQPAAPVVSSTTTSNAESSSSTSKLEDEIKVASRLRKFTFNDLKLATRNFRPESLLGEGGFGCVFKGWIEENGTAPVKPGTGLTVAVKTLNHDGLQGHKEWLAEVNYLGDLIHPNLVKLIGYCIEDDQRLLAYEFMPRGSLENHLFRRSLPLPWSIRMKIALGAAKGLAFLHEEAERPVIYRDFKTSNILLDADYNAKLSDFGLAKDGPEGDKTHVSTRVMGTYGYAAPEYVMTERPFMLFRWNHILLTLDISIPLNQDSFNRQLEFMMSVDYLRCFSGKKCRITWHAGNLFTVYCGFSLCVIQMNINSVTGHLTSRSDVYSFGVVLLEMLTGRRSMDKNRPNGEHNLVEWARPHLGERRRFYRLIDPRLEGHFSIKGAQKAAQLAAHCLSRDPKARPLMSEVVEALKPLPNLKDMASSSYYYQTMQVERVGSNPITRNGIRNPAGSLSRNGHRSLSIPNGPHASPYHHQYSYQSPKASVEGRLDSLETFARVELEEEGKKSITKPEYKGFSHVKDHRALARAEKFILLPCIEYIMSYT
ncbi:hypothetical protein V6N12_005840 [Hibiscus sabdariffa]|uniref:Protein kinase domain-containing protein n=1 Tax=Hibiscus sabdariffa TaxID=183260 RepID=A0ABR2EW89_9ROSI